MSACTITDPGYLGVHASRPMLLDREPVTSLAATVRLVQAVPVPGYPLSGIPLVELTLNLPAYEAAPEEEYHVVLRGEQAQALGRMLVSAGRECCQPEPLPFARE